MNTAMKSGLPPRAQLDVERAKAREYPLSLLPTLFPRTVADGWALSAAQLAIMFGLLEPPCDCNSH